MNKIITQKMKYKQSVIKYSYKHGVKKAAIQFNEWPKTIYRWRERYEGSIESLKDKSRRPHSHPNQHTEQEIKMIRNYKRNNKEPGLVVLWVKLMEAGYTRTIQGLYHVLQKLGIYEKAPSKAKEKEKGEKFYQYTAIDEFTRIRYTWFTNEHSTYMSSEFVKRVVRYYPFKIETIQTDNGFEFTNRLNWNKAKREQKTMFETTLEKLKIKYRQIKPYTPKENGKVERSHRKDQERFYYKKVFYSLEDLRNRGRDWRKEYNNFPMRPLGWLSPNEFLKRYKSQEESSITI